MQTENNQIETLFNKYLDESITREEFNEFWKVLGEQDIQTLTPQLQNLWLRTEGIAPLYSDQEWNRKLKALIQKAGEEDAAGQHGGSGTRPRVIRMWKWIAAACIVLAVGVAVVGVLTNNHKEVTKPTATTRDIPAPTNNRAVITLANGQKVYLDSASNGTIAQESNVDVVKNANGEVVYAMSPAGGGGLDESSSNKRPGVVLAYNTLFNPRGSKVISLTLSDGSRVWLNSESSLRYPTAFTANTREVEISGEAYFEVKHNAKQPFKVHLPNGSIVEDIGTSFNINAYSDESDFKATLIEGSVRVVGGDASNKQKVGNGVILKPGQQAEIIRNAQPITHNNVDLDQVTAWKNGLFSFDKADITTIMREISRWYDLDVEYKGDVKELFRLKTNRNTSVANIFKILEATGAVDLKVEGKKITVMK